MGSRDISSVRFEERRCETVDLENGGVNNLVGMLGNVVGMLGSTKNTLEISGQNLMELLCMVGDFP